jgi:hypothetical protein
LWVSGGEIVCQVDDAGQIGDPQAGLRGLIRLPMAADEGCG